MAQSYKGIFQTPLMSPCIGHSSGSEVCVQYFVFRESAEFRNIDEPKHCFLITCLIKSPWVAFRVEQTPEGVSQILLIRKS